MTGQSITHALFTYSIIFLAVKDYPKFRNFEILSSYGGTRAAEYIIMVIAVWISTMNLTKATMQKINKYTSLCIFIRIPACTAQIW